MPDRFACFIAGPFNHGRELSYGKISIRLESRKGPTALAGRQGGLGKRRHISWAHQAMHQAQSVDDLKKPLACVVYRTSAGMRAETAVYIFDQEAAKYSLPYFIEGGSGWRSGGYRLRVVVSKEHEPAALAIVERLRPVDRPLIADTPVIGDWREIFLSERRFKNTDWRFAVYSESSFSRTDGQAYVAFLFRNKHKSIWGVQEVLGEGASIHRPQHWQRMAARVIDDQAFRESLISNDPDLPAMWRRR
jgi:hypothetical protein